MHIEDLLLWRGRLRMLYLLKNIYLFGDHVEYVNMIGSLGRSVRFLFETDVL